MKKQLSYEARPLDSKLGTPEFEAKFNRIWNEYKKWFKANEIKVGATKADYRDSKKGIRIEVACGDTEEKILQYWIKFSSCHPVIDNSCFAN